MVFLQSIAMCRRALASAPARKQIKAYHDVWYKHAFQEMVPIALNVINAEEVVCAERS